MVTARPDPSDVHVADGGLGPVLGLALAGILALDVLAAVAFALASANAAALVGLVALGLGCAVLVEGLVRATR